MRVARREAMWSLDSWPGSAAANGEAHATIDIANTPFRRGAYSRTIDSLRANFFS